MKKSQEFDYGKKFNNYERKNQPYIEYIYSRYSNKKKLNLKKV